MRLRRIKKEKKPAEKEGISSNEYAYMSTLEPLLTIKNKDGFWTEHVPADWTRYAPKLCWQMILLRNKLGLNIYYWQTRHLYTAYVRKNLDMMFAAHVLQEHDGKPEHSTERKHYIRLLKKYGNEITYFEPLIREMKVGSDRYLDGYLRVYKEKWLNQPFPEMVMLYHGVSFRDYLDFTDYEHMFLNKKRKELKARAAAHKRWDKHRAKNQK